jgi:hypothetical protein
MSDTPYSPPKPPKTITKIQEDQFLDFASTYTWVLLFFVAVALVIVYFIGNKAVIGFESKSNIAITGALGIALIIWLVIWIKYFSTSEKVDKQFLLFNFRVKEVKGQHVINKFDVPETILHKIVPIVAFHQSNNPKYPGCIIEFRDKKWGILMETFPKRISDEEREEHEKKIEKVINGIPANTHFKTIACSRLQPRRSIEQYLLELSTKKTGKKAVDRHLTGLYNKIASDGTPVISWKYYTFQSLGEQPSLEAARIQYGAVIPGLIKNMKIAKLRPRIYEDPKEIAAAYRTMFSEMVI